MIKISDRKHFLNVLCKKGGYYQNSFRNLKDKYIEKIIQFKSFLIQSVKFLNHKIWYEKFMYY